MKIKMKILLTAFDPFGGEPINPAQEAVHGVAEEICGANIVKLTVPTVFARAIGVVTEAISAEKPDAILLIGQAGGRSAITPERVAINISDARIPDNEGHTPIDEPVRPDGPAAYFSTLPIKKIIEAIRAEGLPASVSNTAGTFVCNHLMFGVLDYLAAEMPNTIGGFMHVPFAPEQTAKQALPAPSMSLADITKGIEAALRAIIGHLS